MNGKGILLAAITTFLFTVWLSAVVFKGTYGKKSPNYDAVQFAREKPELVRALKSRYQVQLDQVERNLLRTEKSPQDVLIEEVTKQLDPKN